jgi:RNA polymerase sigma-70 factor (ECF subfamily)
VYRQSPGIRPDCEDQLRDQRQVALVMDAVVGGWGPADRFESLAHARTLYWAMTASLAPSIQPDVLAGAAAGDEMAFARIVDAHHDDMVRVVYVVCGDVEIAHEAVAAAWAIAWRKLRSLRDADRLRPWLCSIAINEGRHLMRRRHVSRVHVLEVPIEAIDDRSAAVGAAAPTDAALLDLRNALARLDASERSLLALRYLLGFDATELGRATGMSPSGTRARLARIIDRLRWELRDE